MKNMKGCTSTQIHQLSTSNNRRHPSAGTFYTSSAGAVISLILVLAFTFVFNLISPTPTYADSISLSIDTNNLAINIMPTSSAGDFAKSSNMNISVSTTCTSGYTLGIASSTGSTDLTNQSDNTAKITSVSSPIPESDFSNSSNTQYNNKWGYKPSQYAILDNEGHPTTYPNTNFRPLPGTNGEIIAKTECANGTAPCTNPVDTYTLSIGARANNQTIPGKYDSDTFIIMAVVNKNIPCNSTKLCVKYDANGLSYPETSSQLPRTVNNVNYNSTITSQTITKYSHTPNVNDAGIASGTYSNNMDTTDSVTIDGVASLNVTIYYDAESTSYDWVSVYQSPFDISRTNDATVSTTTGNLSGKLSGRKSGRTTTYSSWYTKSYTVSGDTVKFHFRSDSSQNYYGYYAIITGTSTTYERSVSSGEYATPTGTNSVFHGWSTSQTTPGGGLPSDVEYTNESVILAKMPGDEGETKTLYAVWQQGQAITFTMDSNVTKIDVLDASGATVGTITSSGQSLVLVQGDTYTIKPTHTTGYITNAITKTSGAGTLNGKQFTVGAGSATINVTSKPLSPMQNWTGCSSLTQGDTEEVYDTRDNEVYLIGKLADGKCWMLDNLRLDITNSTILNGLTTTNTHVDPASLTSLKSGNRGAGAQYASSGFVKWDSSSSSSVFNQAKANADYKDTTTTSYGAGSGKIGVYYNYCAASAGSYCYDGGSGTGNASYDLCPVGWRMPTGNYSGEYQALYTAYSSDATSFRAALSTPFSGDFDDGSANNQGRRGNFWSSTYDGDYNMYNLSVDSSYVYPSSNDYRVRGFSVRCLLSS